MIYIIIHKIYNFAEDMNSGISRVKKMYLNQTPFGSQYGLYKASSRPLYETKWSYKTSFQPFWDQKGQNEAQNVKISFSVSFSIFRSQKGYNEVL